jgi:hypothetical protein
MNHPLSTLDQNRQKEIADYMTEHLWVAQYQPKSGTWVMMKEPYLLSHGPFEVLSAAKTLEEAFDKAKNLVNA